MANNQQLERRVARLERELQAARGIGTKAKLRNNLNHGGYQSEHLAAPTSGADSVSKDSVNVALPDVGATGVYTTANITVDSKGRVTTAANGSGGLDVGGTGAETANTSPTTWSSLNFGGKAGTARKTLFYDSGSDDVSYDYIMPWDIIQPFAITAFTKTGPGGTTTVHEIGDGTLAGWTFTAAYSETPGTSAEVEFTGGSGWPIPMAASDFESSTSEPSTNITYPEVNGSVTFNLKVVHGGVTYNTGTGQAADKVIYFRNKTHYGKDEDATLDNAAVLALSNSSFVTTSFVQSAVSLTFGGTEEYIHYLYPERLSGTPKFWIGGFEVAFTLVDAAKDVTNSLSFEEEYKHYRSPNKYADATIAFEVTT